MEQTPMQEEKQNFIGSYLDKKMKNHGLPESIPYYNKVARHEEEAEKLWNKKLKLQFINHEHRHPY